jgi:FkbH-like protein
MILQKYRAYKRELLSKNVNWLDKKVAILGGSTFTDVRKCLEIYLLEEGIKPEFYESEYGQYWQDSMFPGEELTNFSPDIIYIHTSNRNISEYPKPTDSTEKVEELLNSEVERFTAMWKNLSEKYSCPIIQNNFEYPFYRLMGNAEASFVTGKVNFITRLNLKFYEYAQKNASFYINDINWLSANFGLEKWSEVYFWHMYKYALSSEAVPVLAKSISNIIKSIYGKNKKAFALDLDNTLWGGIVGDDGAENLEMGQETPTGQVFAEFQQYVKSHKDLGVILNVVSKNEQENALSGLNHPDSILKPEDFIMIKANWEPKSENLQAIAHELSLLPESFVFVDDNPAERAIINQVLPNVPTPELGNPEDYIRNIDKQGYFEVTNLTKDDIYRNEQYKENAQRSKLQTQFTDYGEYLKSLEMTAEIRPFSPMYMSRIAQLTNKSNQFNLTTLRCTQEEIENFSKSENYVTLYGKLSDKFGDNGVVSVVLGEIIGKTLHVRLWLMSCRVLKRDMEFAMFDKLVEIAKEKEIEEIYGYYYSTAKNAMVSNFWDKMGFLPLEDKGEKIYLYKVEEIYKNKQNFITIIN